MPKPVFNQPPNIWLIMRAFFVEPMEASRG